VDSSRWWTSSPGFPSSPEWSSASEIRRVRNICASGNGRRPKSTVRFGGCLRLHNSVRARGGYPDVRITPQIAISTTHTGRNQHISAIFMVFFRPGNRQMEADRPTSPRTI